MSRLIRERKVTPKEERMRMKQDSVDEVDTTDLENWALLSRVKKPGTSRLQAGTVAHLMFEDHLKEQRAKN